MSESDMEMDLDDQVCLICKEDINDVRPYSKVTPKGAKTINESSRKRGRKDVVAQPEQLVHSDCRKAWNNENNITKATQPQKPASPVKRRTRVSMGLYDKKTDCLFCGQLVVRGSHGHDEPNSDVLTDTFAKSILAKCEERSDNWAFTVKGRIEYFGNELSAADCIYHTQCSSNFRNIRFNIPEQFRAGPSEPKRKRVGRPRDENQQQAFERVCDYLETNDEEQLTIADLVSKMKDFLMEDDSVPYGKQYLKERLKAYYGDSIYIAEGARLDDIVTMREKTSKILRDYFKSATIGDQESQKRAIIKTAAKLMKSDIKTYVPSEMDQYPPSQSLQLGPALDYLPSSLRSLLNSMLVGVNKHEKVASIGHSIVQAVRPRTVIAPLQIGLASQLHYLYRSKFMVDSLSSMGFCSSYSEVQRFEKNAAGVVASNVLGGPSSADMVLFAADNVDHNIRTIDGKDSFHGMES